VTSLVSFQLFGGGNLYFRTAENESAAAVIISSTEPSDLSLSIENQNESMVYYSDRQKSTDKYMKLFDFSPMKDGTYHLIAYVDNEKITKTFEIRDSKLSILKDEEPDASVTEPIIRKSDDYLVCIFDNPFEAAVNISFSQDNKVFFEDFGSRGSDIQKKYDLSELPVGEYEVTLNSGSYYYTYPLTINL
jgi:hypothetical protein